MKTHKYRTYHTVIVSHKKKSTIKLRKNKSSQNKRPLSRTAQKGSRKNCLERVNFEHALVGHIGLLKGLLDLLDPVSVFGA